MEQHPPNSAEQNLSSCAATGQAGQLAAAQGTTVNAELRWVQNSIEQLTTGYSREPSMGQNSGLDNFQRIQNLVHRRIVHTGMLQITAIGYIQ